jgi:hypothetical protein
MRLYLVEHAEAKPAEIDPAAGLTTIHNWVMASPKAPLV